MKYVLIKIRQWLCNHKWDYKIDFVVTSDKYTGNLEQPFHGYYIRRYNCIKCNKNEIRIN